MPERWFIFDALGPEEALTLLAGLTSLKGELSREMTGIRIGLKRDSFGCQVELAYLDPESVAGRRSEIKGRKKFLNAMVDSYREMMGNQPRHEEEVVAGGDFEPGLAGLILNCTEDEQDPAPLLEDESLVVSRDLTPGLVADQYNNILLHASHAYVAETQSPVSGHQYILFHVKHDRERLATFQALLGAPLFKYSEVLNCLEAGEHWMFLPDANRIDEGGSTHEIPIRPGAAALRRFCAVLRCVRDLPEVEPNTGKTRLAAIAPYDAEASQDEDGLPIHDLLLLGRVKWRSQFNPRLMPVDVASYEVHDLVDSKAAQQTLRQAIDEYDTQSGYRLELKEIKQAFDNDLERERIKEKLAELEHRLEYLNGARIPCPQLYRFTAEQLPALAFTLRGFHLKSLNDGAVTYGYQANAEHPAGVHYLMVDASHAVETEACPVPVLEGVMGAPMRFQVDPVWARHYLPHSSDTLLYVPHGHTLFPSLHDWEAEESDDYLRDVLGPWFHQGNGQAEIPGKPMFVFDGLAGPGREIRITTLDQEGFVPITQKTGWINDNLRVLEAVPIEDLVHSLATEVERQRLHEAVQKESQTAVRESTAVIHEATHEIGRSLKELMTGYNEEVPKLKEFLSQMDHEVAGQKLSLKKMRDQKEVMANFLAEAESGLERVSSISSQVSSDLAALRLQVADSIVSSDAALEELNGKVSKKISQLEAEKKDLLAKLKTAHRIFD